MDRKKMSMTLIALIAVLAMCFVAGCKTDKQDNTTPGTTQSTSDGSGSVEIDLPNEEDGEDDVEGNGGNVSNTSEATDPVDATGDGEGDAPNGSGGSDGNQGNAGSDGESGNTGNDGNTGSEGNTGNQGGNKDDSPVITDEEEPDVQVDFDDLFN